MRGEGQRPWARHARRPAQAAHAPWASFLRSSSSSALLLLLFLCLMPPIHAVSRSAVRAAPGRGALSRRLVAVAPRASLMRVAMATEAMPDLDGALFAVALGLATYASGYATEGYEPHKL